MIYRLVHNIARANAMEGVRTAPEGWIVEVKEPTRTLEQNAKFHALCSDVAKSDVEWMGRRPTAHQWKVLFVSGHSVATGIGVDVVTGLEGELVNIRESTARMSRQRGSSLIEYVMAWATDQGLWLPVERDRRTA